MDGCREIRLSFDSWWPPTSKFDAYAIMGRKPTVKDHVNEVVAKNMKVSIVEKKGDRLPKYSDWKCHAVKVTHWWGH